MRNKYLLTRAALSCSFVLMTACVNQLDDKIEVGDIPIHFSTTISNASTRVTGKSFSQGDQVGLFATISPSAIDTERYIDNLKLTCTDGNLLVGEREIFYPEGDATLDFICHYPYQKEGVPAGTATVSVAVQTNQSTAAGFSESDFLIARKNEVTATKEPVKLTFKHQFVKLKIELLPQNGESIDDLFLSDPKVTASGFYTQADCNLQTGVMSNLRTARSIAVHGAWKKENGKLTGKEVIVIPQSIAVDKQAFLIDWNGKIYTCPLSIDDLNGNGQCTVSIKALQSVNNTLTGVVGEIEDWEESTKSESESDYQITSVQINALSFNTSDVYRVYKQGKAVAEVCKEYLTATDITSRAIVVYPVANEQAQLENGKVLQLLDKTENVHGGSVSWNKADNKLNYTPGTSAPIEEFYISDEGKVVFEKPTTTTVIHVSSYTLRDIRGSVLQNYPVVKIGTQYWMKRELKATTYKDGTPLTKKTVIGNGAGYFVSDNQKVYYYNGEAVLAGQLAPNGWKIPTTKEWNALKTYVGSVSTLKTGDWKSPIAETAACPATNQTGFSAYPIGLWLGTQTGTSVMVGYWSTDDTGKNIPEKTVFFTGDSDDYNLAGSLASGQNFYKALSIRCLKE